MNDYLMHHGILGMKWGRRRYQNPDGTLTAEGRARYGSGTSPEPKARGEKVKKAAKTAAAVVGGVGTGVAAGVAGAKAYKRHQAETRTAKQRSWMKKDDASKEKKGINEDIFKPGKDGKASQAEKGARAGSDIFDSAGRIRKRAIRLKNQEAIAKEQAKIKSMSDAELRQRINRLNMEKQYRQLSEEDIAVGKASTEDILGIVGDVLAIGVSAATIGTMIYSAKKGK